MTEAVRLKQIARQARKAVGDLLHSLYFEVYGADFAGAVTEDRARVSILEAVKQLLDKPVVRGQEKIMEELIKQMIEEQKITNRYLSQLVGTNPRMTATEVVEGQRAGPTGRKKARPETEMHVDGKGKREPEEKIEKVEEPKITIEQLREMATRYSAAFTMEDLLSLNQKIGGAKKLSAIDPSNYAVLYKEMEERLSKENGKKATSGTPSPERTEKIEAITLDVVKEKAKAFMDKNGQGAIVALLKAFGAGKLSELAVEKYPAFIEAISEQG